MAKSAAPAKPNTKSDASATFGKTIYALRLEKGYSQEELSFRCGIDRSYFGQLERGEKEPCLAMILKLTAGLDTPLSEFFRRFEEEDGKQQVPAGRKRRIR